MITKSILDDLIGMSRELARPERDLVILGEGNTSAACGDGSFWLKASGINPLVSLGKSEQWIEPGFVWDIHKEEYVYERDTSGRFDEKNEGWELGIGNVFYIRRGHRTENIGEFWAIDGDTEGWGLNLQAGRYGGFRFDQATVPQA